MNVCVYVLYRIIKYEFDHVMNLQHLLCMSPQRSLSWYDQRCPEGLPAVDIVPRVAPRPELVNDKYTFKKENTKPSYE